MGKRFAGSRPYVDSLSTNNIESHASSRKKSKT